MKRLSVFMAIIVLMCAGQSFPQKVLSLSESKQLALQNNAKNKNSKLQMEASQKVKQSAFTNYFPQISASAVSFKAQKPMMEIESKGGNLPVYDGNPANLMTATQFAYFPSSTMEMLKKGTLGFVNIIQPVFAGGRIVNGNKLASLGNEVSEYQSRLASEETMRKTEEQYWQIVSLDEKAVTLVKYEELLKSLLKQVEDAYKSGVAMKNDMLKVKLKLSEVRLNQSKLDNGRKLAVMAFCQYIGISYDSTLKLQDNLEIKDTPQSYYVDNNESLVKRTEYSLLKKSVEAEQLQTKMKIGEFLPQAAIGLNGTFMKFDESKSRTFGILFGTVSVPISGWWGGSYDIQEHHLKEQIAENNMKDNSELLLLQMQKSWTDLKDAYKQYELCIESKAQAEENLRVNEDSHKNGLSTVSDLLEAQALLQQTRDNLTDAQASYKTKAGNYLSVTARAN